MEAMDFTFAVFHLSPPCCVCMAWSNFAAPSNMEAMVVTAAVSQLAQLPFCLPKSEAPLNMFDMSVTAAVFHKFVDEVGMFWSNFAASSNMEAMVSTAAVLHLVIEPCPKLITRVLMFWSNAAAPLNMEAMVSTRTVSHSVMSWLNAAAPSNMEAMDFTFAVFHLSPPCCVCMAWSNFAAPLNMEAMVVTAAVFQSLTALLNSAAPSNMEAMVVTAAVSQLAQLPFCLPKSEAPLNMFDMSVTAAVFHKFVDEVGMFWSNFAASLNMEAMFSTRAVFQEEMSLLN